MAAQLLLRGGGAAALKTMLLEAPVFRGLATTVSLTAESGKNEKRQPPSSEKQSPPKNVGEPKERGRLLTTRTAAALSQSLSPPSSDLSAGSKGGATGSPHPAGSMLLTDEGVLKPLPGKTRVEFPQKIPSPFREPGSDSGAPQHGHNGMDDSSSSSSSSSDSESDEEGLDSKVGPRVVSKSKGGLPKPETIRPFENRAPKIAISAKEKTQAWKPHTDVTYPEKLYQPKKKGPPTKPLEVRKEAKPKPRSQGSEEVLKQNVKEEPLKKILRSNEIDKESKKPFKVQEILPDHTKAGSSAGLRGSSVSTLCTEEAGAGEKLPAATPGARGRHLEPKVPEPAWKGASPLAREENSQKQVAEGHSEAMEEVLEDQVPMRNVKMAPIPKQDVLDEKTAGPELEGRPEEVTSAALPTEAQDGDTQEPAQAPVFAEPPDSAPYKNLQHHDYNTFTFLDLNLDLSKFRMPQPSSGRVSPRH